MTLFICELFLKLQLIIVMKPSVSEASGVLHCALWMYISSPFFISVSGSARKNASNSTKPRPIRVDEWGPFERPLLSIRIHLLTTAGRTLPNLSLWEPMYAAKQHHGDREHLRAGCKIAFQRGGMGQEYPFFPWSADHRSGGSAKADLEWVVCAECCPVFDAVACGPSAGCCRPPCFTDVRRQSGCLHGSHQDLPGASGKTESSARWLGRIQLS